MKLLGYLTGIQEHVPVMINCIPSHTEHNHLYSFQVAGPIYFVLKFAFFCDHITTQGSRHPSDNEGCIITAAM